MINNDVQKIRIPEIDILRGVGIVFVIIGHSIIFYPINIMDVPWCDSLYDWIYSFHMPLLFFVAGSVYHCSNYGKFVNKKIDRLLIPYCFWGLIIILLRSSEIGVVNVHNKISTGVISFLLYGGEYWFLYVLFVIFLVYPLIEKVCPKPWMELIWGVGGIILCELVLLPRIFNLNSVIYHLPYFVMGRFFLKYLSLGCKYNNWQNIGLFVSLLIIYFLIDRYYVYGLITLKYVRAIIMILCFYAVSRCMLRLEELSSMIGCCVKFFKSCSRYSLQLYLLNSFLLVLIRTVLVNVLHITNPIVIVISITFFDILITLLICNNVITRMRWLSWLCGIGERPWVLHSSER